MAGLFSKQRLLRGVALGLRLLEIQIRLVVGMLGALLARKQTFNGQQLHAGIFLAGGAFIKASGSAVGLWLDANNDKWHGGNSSAIADYIVKLAFIVARS